MAISKEIRAKVEAELSLGESPRDLARKYPDASYQTILGWQKKLNVAELENDVIIDLVKADTTTLTMVAEGIKAKAPAEVVKQIDNLVDGVNGLKNLESKFQSLVLKLLESADTMAGNKELSVRDWKVLSDGISNLYTSIFNKAGINVSVHNQNTVSGESLSLFKNTMSK